MKRNDPSTADTVTNILAAMVRVLSGHPTVATPGDLTITAVVAEAQVKRHLLTHKHTALKELFYQLRDTCSNPLIVRAEKVNGLNALSAERVKHWTDFLAAKLNGKGKKQPATAGAN